MGARTMPAPTAVASLRYRIPARKIPAKSKCLPRDDAPLRMNPPSLHPANQLKRQWLPRNFRWNLKNSPREVALPDQLQSLAAELAMERAQRHPNFPALAPAGSRAALPPENP